MKKRELFNNETKELPYQRQPEQQGLYDAANEHDACGVGMLVNIHGEKSHDIVESALKVLENMRHRGAEGAERAGNRRSCLVSLSHRSSATGRARGNTEKRTERRPVAAR